MRSRKQRQAELDAEQKRAKAQYEASLIAGRDVCRKVDATRQKVRDAMDTGSFEPITGVIEVPHALAH